MSEGERSKGKTLYSRHVPLRDSKISADIQYVSTRSLVRKRDLQLFEQERNEQELLARIMTTAESICCDSPRAEDTKQQCTPQSCSLDRTREKGFDFSRFKILQDKSSLQVSKISNFEVSKFTFRSNTRPKRRFVKKAEAGMTAQASVPDRSARSLSLRENPKKKALLNMPRDTMSSTQNEGLRSKKVLPQIKSSFGNICSKIRYQTGRSFYPHLLSQKDVQRKKDFQELTNGKHILVPEVSPEETKFSFTNPRLAFNIETVYREKPVSSMTEAIEQFYAGKRSTDPESATDLLVVCRLPETQSKE